MRQRSRTRALFPSAYPTGRAIRMRAVRLDGPARYTITPLADADRAIFSSLPMMCSAMAVGLPASSARTGSNGCAKSVF